MTPRPRTHPMSTTEEGGAPAPAAAPAATPPAPTPPADRTVSHDVYRRVVEAKQGLETQVGTLKDQVAALSEKSATVDTLAASVETWKGKATDAAARFEQYKVISAALGTTDTEAIETAEWTHSRLPEEGRPAIDAWLTDIKAEPETAPKALATWLTPAADPAAPTAAATRPAPKNPANGTTQTGAPATVSGEQFRSARDKGVRTGDWSEYKALKKAGGFRVSDKSA